MASIISRSGTPPSELGIYHYKARAYSPTLGRFLQTDPVGYDDQVNLYAYVANDPVNGDDPTGLAGCGSNTKYDAAGCTSYYPNGTPEQRGAAGLAFGISRGALATAGGLAVDDVTGIGVADDPAIPPALAVAGVAAGVGLLLEHGDALIDKARREIGGILARQDLGPKGEQYRLVAARDGSFPSVRGGAVNLKVGETWKIGETSTGRYSAAWLSTNNLAYVVQYRGNQTVAKIQEKVQLLRYVSQYGSLPPGNRIFR